MAHILVVDDAEDICSLLKMALEKDGHQVKAVYSGSALTANLYQHIDLILLDVMLPDEDGFSICRRIRKETDCPILFLTAKGENEDVIKGLSIGGDDYITKPFNLAQLRARVTAHLRRQQRTPVKRMQRGRLSFDLDGKVLYCDDIPLHLTKSEYAICEKLAMRPGLVFSREQLIEDVFGYESESDANAITEHIKNIRSKLTAFQLEPIVTVWGMGYKWNNEKASI